MRTLTLLSLALLTSSCLAPGERDPTRYPWDQPKPALSAPHPPIVARGAIAPLPAPQQRFVPPEGSYCVIAIEPQSNSGITVGGKAPGIMACSVPANPAPKPATPRP